MSYRLDIRRCQRPDQPQPVYKGALGLALWEAPIYVAIGAAQRNCSYRTDERGRLDVRPEWSPEFTWVQPVVHRAVSQWGPAFSSELQSERSRDGIALNVRAYDWTEFGWVANVVDGVVRTWLPAFDNRTNFSTPPRPRVDLRQYDWLPPPAWIFSTLPVTVTVAQQWPAILLGTGLSYRSGDGPRLDVRTDWFPTFGWMQPRVDQIVSSWRPVLDAARSDRTPDRAALDVRSNPAAPEFGWIQRSVDAVTSTWSGIWSQELGSVRSPEKPVLDGRITPVAPDNAGWIFPVLPLTTSIAQRWPAILLGLNPNYRSGDRATLDVCGQEWNPERGWIWNVADTAIARWSPVFDAERSVRTGESRPYGVRTDTWTPEWAYWVAVVAVAPPAHPRQRRLKTWTMSGPTVTTWQN